MHMKRITNMKFKAIAILPVMLLLILSVCTSKKQENDPPLQAVTVPVRIAAIRTGDIQVTVSAYGQTEALQTENVISPISGKLISLPAYEGQHVNRGDTLALLLTTESLAELEGAQALAARAKTPEQKAEAERAWQLAQQNQNLVPIKSQIAGIVVARNVAESAIVNEGSGLFAIMAPQSINFVALVPLENLDGITVGQNATVELTAIPEKDFNASVIAINPQADSSNQTVRVLLHLNDISNVIGKHVQNGMAGTAQIITGEHENAMLVPLAAVLRDDEANTYSVVTLTPDSLSLTVPVTPVLIKDSTMEISSPALHEDMPVVVEGNYALPDSTHVTLSPRKAD